MPDYTLLSPQQQRLMFLVVVLTNLPGFFTLKYIKVQKDYHFEMTCFISAILSSIMYHVSQIYNLQIMMNSGDWHRLDNIFVITGIKTLIVFCSGNSMRKPLRYSCLFTTLLEQQCSPWNFAYTIVPIIIYGVFCAFLRLFFPCRSQIKYQWKYLIGCGVSVFFGSFFMIKGLDQQNDYLRIYHGMWHLFAPIFCVLGLKSVKYSELLDQNHHHHK